MTNVSLGGWATTALSLLVVGTIPGMIAARKGYSFALWWVYGTLFFLFALPGALLLPRVEQSALVPAPPPSESPSWRRLAGDVLQAVVATMVLYLAMMVIIGLIAVAGDSRPPPWFERIGLPILLFSPPVLLVSYFVLIQVFRGHGRELKAFRVTRGW